MSLKRRLERLKLAQSKSNGAEQFAAPGEGALVPPRAEVNREVTLSDIREELRLALGQSAERVESARQPMTVSRRLEDLPFEAVATPEGTVLSRRKRYTGSTVIGERPLGAAHSARTDRLAQLALDERLNGLEPTGLLFFDTETTGLAGAGAMAFLVGMATLEPTGGLVVEQLLLDEPEAEPALLSRVEECFERATGLVSFNGKAFDRPLLAARGVMNHRPALPELPHLDLLHVARRLHGARLGRCNLGRMEKLVLGFDRGQDIAGSEIPPIFGHFLRTGDAAELEQVVLHNLWDVLSMVALVGLYGEDSPPLHVEDLAGLARTLRRAGAIEEATDVAERACQLGGGRAALRIRADLAKLRKDHRRATDDLEHLSATGKEPGVRLELAKLYEHVWKLPRQALDWVDQGTSENGVAQVRRRVRLERKIARQSELE